MTWKAYIRSLYSKLTLGRIDSIYWSTIYNNTIIGSKWLIDKAISPGRWAVGYEFLYVLYRVLDEVQPDSILEMGLGQSTKLTGQFSMYYNAKHVVIEHDPTWCDFFLKRNGRLVEKSTIKVLPLESHGNGKDKYFGYEGYIELLKDEQFSLISVDGPWGGEGSMSRRDILPLLPNILKNDFVIMFDDCGRAGEARTVAEVEKVLKSKDVEYAEGIYFGGGTKITVVITSRQLKFLTTL